MVEITGRIEQFAVGEKGTNKDIVVGGEESNGENVLGKEDGIDKNQGEEIVGGEETVGVNVSVDMLRYTCADVKGKKGELEGKKGEIEGKKGEDGSRDEHEIMGRGSSLHTESESGIDVGREESRSENKKKIGVVGENLIGRDNYVERLEGGTKNEGRKLKWKRLAREGNGEGLKKMVGEFKRKESETEFEDMEIDGVLSDKKLKYNTTEISAREEDLSCRKQ